MENIENSNLEKSTPEFIEQILHDPIEFKTTHSVDPPDILIPKEDQVNMTDFLHVLLSSLKDLAARPLMSCEKAYPPLLRKKAFSRDEIRRIRKKSEGLHQIDDEYIQKLKENISKIPDFSQKYDYLLRKKNC